MEYEETSDDLIPSIKLEYDFEDGSRLYVQDAALRESNPEGQIELDGKYSKERYEVRSSPGYAPHENVLETFADLEDAENFADDVLESTQT